MTLVSPPTNIACAFRINAGDGSLSQLFDTGGTAGSSALGMMTICVVNMGSDISLPSGVVSQFLQANAGISLPFARYVCDWQALKVAAAAGRGLVFNIF